MAACANKTRREIQVHNNKVIRGLHRPMLLDGCEGKMLKNVVLLRILSISGKKGKKITEQQRMNEFTQL